MGSKMVNNAGISTAAVFFLVLFSFSQVDAEVTVEPYGLGISVVQNDVAAVELMLMNSDQEEVVFSIDYEIIEDELRQGGPHRDDLGDVIDEFVPEQVGVGDRYVTALAWDWDLQVMWLTESDNPLIIAVDPANEYEVVSQFRGPGGDRDGSSGACWHEGVLYLVGWVNHNWLYRYDTQGNNIGNFNIPASAGACGASVENGWLFAMGSNQVIYVFDTDDDFREIGQIQNYPQFLQGQLAQSMCWVDQHRDGQLWLNSRGDNGNNNVWEILVDTEEWEAVELIQHYEVQEEDMGHPRDGIGHDGENLWLAHWSIPQIRIVDDGVNEFRLVTFEPVEGVIQGEDSEQVIMNIAPEGAEPGIYNLLLTITLDDPDNPEIELQVLELSVVISVGSPTFDLAGVVTSAEGNAPVPGAMVVMDRYLIRRSTDEEGAYSFDDLPLGEYNLTFTAPEFLPHTEQVVVEEEGEVNRDIELLHAECNPDVEWVREQLAPDEETHVQFNVDNDGNGPLTYTIERRLLGDLNVEPWGLRQSYQVSDITDDGRIEGVVLVNDQFYVCGAAGNDPNYVYIIDRNGNLTGGFEQFGDSRYGMRDLAYDGTLIWGCEDRQVYGFTPGGDLRTQLDDPNRPSVATAWDSDRNLLWMAGTTTEIVGIDLDGNEIQELDSGDLRIYGLAYWRDDPDGYPLYVFSSPGNNVQEVYKMETGEGDIMFVRTLEPEGDGRPGGAFITDQLDIYSWVFINIANAGSDDRIDLWQIDARLDWMQVEPDQGVIQPDERQQFDLILDSEDLPGAEFEGELVFLHDGLDGETSIPVTLNVVEGPGPAERTLDLELGWNMVSLNLEPDEVEIIPLMAPLVDEDLLILMKNDNGRFYNPEFDYNDIPGWDYRKGYLVKVSEDCEMTVGGISVIADEPIPLFEGWQMVSYFPRVEVEVPVALGGLGNILLIAKDDEGHFCLPAWGFNDMEPMREGKGYLVKVSEDINLVYRMREEEAGFVSCNSVHRTPSIVPEYFTPSVKTGVNMSLLVITDPSIEGEIGVYCGDLLVGAGVVQNGMCGIAVWGDDGMTSGVKGAVDGQELKLVIHDANGDHEAVVKTIEGEGFYHDDDVWIVELESTDAVPTEFRIISAYPNPFNAAVNIGYSLDEEMDIRLGIFDHTGRLIAVLHNGITEAGYHTLTWTAGDVPSGIYLCRLESTKEHRTLKLVLVR